MRKRPRLRRFAGLTTLAAAAAVAALLLVPGATGSGAAAYTTAIDDGSGDPKGCLNGHGIDCNIYDTKQDVYVNGGPTNGPGLPEGDYYFSVLVPGYQNGGFIDGADGNLSDTTAGATDGDGGIGDDYTCRTLHVDADGAMTYTGDPLCAHAQGPWVIDSAVNVTQLFPYDDTSNNGGVYIMAICEVGATDPSACKYDAFKVKGGDETPPAADLTVTKDATPAFTLTYPWSITKGVDACKVTSTTPNGCSMTSSTKTLNYSVVLTKGAGVPSAWTVTGTITVANPNMFDVSGVDVTDAVDNGGTCSVTNGTNITVPGEGSSQVSYSCSYPSTGPSASAGNNVATATWPAAVGSTNTTANSGNVPFSFATATPTLVHDSVTLSDVYSTTPNPLPPGFGAALSGGSFPSGSISSSTTFNYSYLVTVPHDCVQLNNTASFTDAAYTGSASITAKVCRVPPQTGALTIGYWQNKNGQGIISGGASTAGVCNSGTWLRQFAPFQDLSATATCSQVAAYDVSVFKAATCSGPASAPCNAMLKAQMLATAFNVYFSSAALGGNKINAPAPIGGLVIDLTNVCKMIDGTGGTASCSGSYESASAAFGGATSLSVLQILTYAATQSNAGGSDWYGDIKATQVLAKNVFDAINNRVAFIV